MPMPTVVGVGTSVNGTGNITPPYPGGYTAVADDVAVTFVETESEILVPPTNWAQVTTVNVASGTITRLTALWRRLTAAEAAPAITTTANHKVGRMIVVRDLRPVGNPYEAAPTTTELVADTTVSIPGTTTTFPNCLMLYAFSTGQDITSSAGATGWANAALGSVTERMDDWTATGLGGGFAVASGTKAVAGATGAMTATLSLTANFKTLMCIALVGADDEAKHPLIRSARPIEGGAVGGNYAPAVSSTILGG